MSNIKLTYPYLLFLIIPLVILSVVIFFFIPKQKKIRSIPTSKGTQATSLPL